MSFESTVLTLEVQGHVATLWLDRVEARNAMGRDLWQDLPRGAAEVAENSDVRALIIAARGPHFTVGLDLKQMGSTLMGAPAERSAAQKSESLYRDVRRMQDAITCFAELKIPVIAAVHGYCIGGGIDLICAADVRYASSDAIFSVREAKVAIVADLGTLQRLPKIVSAGHVAELAFTGKDIDAARAERIGLVNDVVDGSADAVYARALELATEIAANSPLVVAGTKTVLAANEGRTVQEGLEFVAAWNTMYLQSNDLNEAMAAFMEKRQPTFRGN
ncbi:MAG: crotonase/enoyl-CoA hydratase family protein [Actinomycetes bacterium]